MRDMRENRENSIKTENSPIKKYYNNYFALQNKFTKTPEPCYT